MSSDDWESKDQQLDMDYVSSRPDGAISTQRTLSISLVAKSHIMHLRLFIRSYLFWRDHLLLPSLPQASESTAVAPWSYIGIVAKLACPSCLPKRFAACASSHASLEFLLRLLVNFLRSLNQSSSSAAKACRPVPLLEPPLLPWSRLEAQQWQSATNILSGHFSSDSNWFLCPLWVCRQSIWARSRHADSREEELSDWWYARFFCSSCLHLASVCPKPNPTHSCTQWRILHRWQKCVRSLLWAEMWAQSRMWQGSHFQAEPTTCMMTSPSMAQSRTSTRKTRFL